MKKCPRKRAIFWFLLIITIANAITTACATQSDTKSLADQTQELINQNKFQQAYEMLKPLADTGDPQANFGISLIYGDQDEKNPYYDLKKEEKALRIAAKAGHAWAQIGLAQTLQHQVIVKAKDFLYDYSQPELKQFTNKKYQEACMWYEKAARQGEGYAMFDTARCYRDGYVTAKKDFITAYAWFALAAGRFKVEKGDKYSPQSMAEIFMQRTARRGKLNEAQIQKALEIAENLQKEIVGTRRK